MNVTWGQAISVWFGFLWRSVAYSLLAGVVVGFFFGFAAAALKLEPGQLPTIIGALAGVPMSWYGMKQSLVKHGVTFVKQNGPDT